MKRILPLFVFIDACGWEILKDRPFCKSLAPGRRRLTSVFGYSSACVPSIVSGAWPSEHRNWCYFVYDPANSPFKSLRPLRFLPRAITSRRRFRRYLSKFVKAQLNFRGYFDLYNIPFRHISLFDFSEKKNPLQPGGMNRGANIFDFLQSRNIPYHVSDPRRSESENLNALLQDIDNQSVDFAFLYWPGLDGFLHMAGNDSPGIGDKLRWYEEKIGLLMQAARSRYKEVRLHVFSDHGMANCDQHIDLRSRIERLPVQFGRDYVAVYDSTMARFWFFNDEARRLIADELKHIQEGRIVPEEELKDLGAYFPDGYFGEMIFLVREGVLIVPSFMGERPIRAMHGYHPSEPQSYAALLSNRADLPEDVTDIPHVYRLMKADAESAHAANRREYPLPPLLNHSLVAAGLGTIGV